MPYHRLGVSKYAQLDRDYAIEGNPALDDTDLERIQKILLSYGLAARVIKH